MNTTLMGLVIAVPCVLVYSLFRSRIDETIIEIDRYAVVMLKVLTPDDMVQKNYNVSERRLKEEVETEPNMVPFMNLMVVLIPLLLSSSEFIKIGTIEIKLPQSVQGAGGGDISDEASQDLKLNLGIAITERGFNLFHYFKKDTTESKDVEIPLKSGKYDYEALNRELAEVKRKALHKILYSIKSDIPDNVSLWQLYSAYTKHDFSAVKLFSDHESIKIIADEKVKYQIVISVMDAARGTATEAGKATMFPNVSIAGGIIQ
jgi:biopolymer transport protein ExbD